MQSNQIRIGGFALPDADLEVDDWLTQVRHLNGDVYQSVTIYLTAVVRRAGQFVALEGNRPA